MNMCAKYKIPAVVALFFAVIAALQGCHHADQTDPDTKFHVTKAFLDELLIDTVQEASALSQWVTDGLRDSPVHSLQDAVDVLCVIDEVRSQIAAVTARTESATDTETTR